MQPEIFFYIIVLIYSIVLHEIAHGYAAYLFGDMTAYYNNRLTLNPLPHVDPIGSVVLPGLLILTGSPMMLGWAKPVPVSLHNLNPYKLGKFTVSIAGILVNILLAITFIIIGAQLENNNLKQLTFIVAIVNMGLAVFNLIPFPPADGYRIIENFLPLGIQRKVDNLLNEYFLLTIVAAIIIASFVFQAIFPIIYELVYTLIF